MVTATPTLTTPHHTTYLAVFPQIIVICNIKAEQFFDSMFYLLTVKLKKKTKERKRKKIRR